MRSWLRRVARGRWAAVLGVCLVPASAAAIVKPNIMIVFDTSGTMLTNSVGSRTGDGSLMCGGVDTTSRVYNLKQGILGALEEIGYDEANFGLMRFPQLEEPNYPITGAPATLQCNGGGNINAYIGTQGRAYAGHYYTRVTGQNACASGISACPAGTCTLAGDQCWTLNGANRCLTPCPSGTCPAGQSCFNFGAGNLLCLALDTTTACNGNANCPAGSLCAPFSRSEIYENFGCWMSNDPNRPPALSGAYASWFDVGFRQSFLVDVTRVPMSGTAPKPAASEFDPPDGNVARVVQWIDGAESGINMTASTVPDPEIHVLNNTPAGRTLHYARLYFENYVKPIDPKNACRSNVVVFITDDDVFNNNCDAFGAALGSVGAGCTGAGDFHPQIAACKLFQNDGVKVYVMTNTGAGAINSPVAAAGGTTSAIEVNLLDASAIKSALVGIIAQSVPPGESCNCADDDCNGMIDETFPQKGTACTVGVGRCKRAGRWGCSAGGGVQCIASAAALCGSAALVPGAPGVEVCTPPPGCLAPTAADCDDENCDGRIDEGLTCTCAAKPEVCNGLDDDCNGMTDDGIPSVTCGLNFGECKPGTTVCSGGVLSCPGAIGPFPEACNGKDDDCDGVTDGISQACYPPATAGCTLVGPTWTCLGVCQTGLATCPKDSPSPHLFGACIGAVGPSTEVACDGLDNDCDGMTDEGFGLGAACGDDTGECAKGTNKCVGGAIVCTGGTGPSPEICDGKDNDCDGVTDNPLGSCGSGLGICKPGTWKCVGMTMTCDQPFGPHPETCNGLDDDCDGSIDNNLTDPSFGMTCGSTVGVCKAGVWKCIGGMKTCDGEIKPRAEVCNNLDDDCDGCTDCGDPAPGCAAKACTVPGAGADCGSGVGECKKGKLTCTAGAMTCSGAMGPFAEVCNGKDDDCNGFTDEDDPALGTACYPASTVGCDVTAGTCVGECQFGNKVCTAMGSGMAGLTCANPVTPKTEACDGKDNDCDGMTDEGFGVGSDCDNGGSGLCKKFGKTICNAKGDGTTCSVPPTTVVPEVCNGMDDDCDGVIDNLPIPGVGMPCGTDVGECTSGTTKCDSVAGKIVCEGATGPVPEVCNGLDDDCDGSVDEDLTPPSTECPPPGLPAGAPIMGECKPGKYVCAGAGGWICKGAVGPSAEVCDGKDNDCDGIVDTTPTCPSGYGCAGGECTPQCGTGEFKCPADRVCKDGYCIPNKCLKVKCAAGTFCREGVCIDPCSLVTCPVGAVCEAGVCKDCHAPDHACPAGQVCGLHECRPDPCFGVDCKGGEYCAAGTCVASCLGVACPQGKSCHFGRCEPDPCADRACTSTQYCDPADTTCKPDPCGLTSCMLGEACVPTTGMCQSDPCLDLRCGDQEACKRYPDGHAECQPSGDGPKGPPKTKVASSGGGGCACATGTAPAAPLSAGLSGLAMALVVGARRRRPGSGK